MKLLFGDVVDRLNFEFFGITGGCSWYLLSGLILRHGGVYETRGYSTPFGIKTQGGSRMR